MFQLLFTTFKPPEALIEKLLEPTEKFSALMSWTRVVSEFALILAVVFIAIWDKKRRSGVESKAEIIDLKRSKKAILEEVKLVVVFAFGLSFVAAMLFYL